MILINAILSVLGLDSPMGVLSGKGLYLIVYPLSRPNTDTVYNIGYKCSGTPGIATLFHIQSQESNQPVAAGLVCKQIKTFYLRPLF